MLYNCFEIIAFKLELLCFYDKNILDKTAHIKITYFIEMPHKTVIIIFII